MPEAEVECLDAIMIYVDEASNFSSEEMEQERYEALQCEAVLMSQFLPRSVNMLA